MNVTSQIKHASDSAEQREMEGAVLVALAAKLGVTFSADVHPQLGGLKLDGFAGTTVPVLVEVFAHVGRAKGGQRHKIAHDMTKLLLAEKRLGVPCRKVIAVIDKAAIAHMENGWDGAFADAFGIERMVVKGFEEHHAAMRAVQSRQRR
jgi:hypothetical protein